MVEATIPPPLTLPGLREIVTDREELAKGTRIFDDRGLQHLARFEHKLFAEATGSGATPYKVQILFEEKVRGRCSCMAARSRPFCKHAAALLVAWARAPEAFAQAETAPGPAPGEAPKKKAVKTGKVDAAALMRSGVEQVATLVRELAASGVASLGRERAEQIAALATSLRESRLRRLSARVIALGELVGVASSGADTFDAGVYAELFTDMVLTARKLEKHLAGEALEDVYVEELVGKTWTKKDRAAIDGLDLVEYGFVARTTPDGFVIRESRLFDLASGTHYSEKQILPQMLVARTEPKQSHAGFRLAGASGSKYPSFAPHRLDLESHGARRLVADERDAVFEALLARCLPTVSQALAAFQQQRRDVFAPDALPVAVRVDTVLADGKRLRVVDGEDSSLFLPDDPLLDPQLAGVLRGHELLALLGDVALDGALPTLFPFAAVVRTRAGLSLRTLGTSDAAAMIGTRAAKRTRAATTTARTSWTETAWAVGIPAPAIALGEVRSELADVLVGGLGGLSSRTTDALVARLRDLGLAKPAELLAQNAAKPDVADRLDDFVKLYQVLGIALTRLVAVGKIDRAALVAVPTFTSVHVPRVDEPLPPTTVIERVGTGSMDRWTAAVHYGAWYERVPVDELAMKIHPTWADGAAQPFVVAAFTARPNGAIDAAVRALGLAQDDRQRWRRPAARMTRLTAIRVLEAVGGADAVALLERFAKRCGDPSLAALSRRAQTQMRAREGQGSGELDREQRGELARLLQELVQAPNKATRARAAAELAEHGYVEAIPFLRSSLAADVASDVREMAAHALGRLGDTEAVDTFVRMLEQRAVDHETAKLGAYALASLGDVRGIAALLRAWAEGWQPAIVSEAVKHVGAAALGPLCDLVEREPEMAKRKSTQNVIEAIDAEEVAAALCESVDEMADDPRFVERATVLATLAAIHPRALAAVASRVTSLRPGLQDKRASKEERALARKLGLATARPSAAKAT